MDAGRWSACFRPRESQASPQSILAQESKRARLLLPFSHVSLPLCLSVCLSALSSPSLCHLWLTVDCVSQFSLICKPLAMLLLVCWREWRLSAVTNCSHSLQQTSWELGGQWVPRHYDIKCQGVCLAASCPLYMEIYVCLFVCSDVFIWDKKGRCWFRCELKTAVWSWGMMRRH